MTHKSQLLQFRNVITGKVITFKDNRDVINKTREQVHSQSFIKWCADVGVDRSAMYKVWRGDRLRHKFWTRVDADLDSSVGLAKLFLNADDKKAFLEYRQANDIAISQDALDYLTKKRYFYPKIKA